MKLKIKHNLYLKQRQVYRSAAAVAFILAITVGLTFYFHLSAPEKAFALPSTGDYQAVTTGNWNSTSTWQKYNGSSWVAASATPTSADGIIEILNGHTVTVTASVTADQV